MYWSSLLIAGSAIWISPLTGFAWDKGRSLTRARACGLRLLAGSFRVAVMLAPVTGSMRDLPGAMVTRPQLPEVGCWLKSREISAALRIQGLAPWVG